MHTGLIYMYHDLKLFHCSQIHSLMHSSVLHWHHQITSNGWL